MPGVYEDWGEASKQIKDVKGPKYRRFGTRGEAEAFVRGGGMATGTGTGTGMGMREEPKKKKVKTASEVAKEGGKKVRDDKTVKVWTDGAARGNGRVGAEAGLGVFFGVDDERFISLLPLFPLITNIDITSNVSEPLEGNQTNQRAELTGIQRALEIAPPERPLEIITDSAYSINCSTTWYLKWKSNGWKTSTGGEVTNKDLVVQIRRLIDEREARGVETTFTWIKGHNDDPGNVAADALAVAGSRKGR